MKLADAVSAETRGAATVLVPVGSLEQHGPHLPLDTDTTVAVAVAEAVAARMPGAWVAPPVAYGSSGEHQSFPGTVSMGSEALRHLLVELVRSLRTWAGRVVFVNGHGGNLTALRSAVTQLVSEGHDVAWAACTPAGSDLPFDAHAGRTETSLMLHLRPDSVREDLAAPGDVRPLAEVLPLLTRGGVEAVSPNGILGDPTGASAHEGGLLLAAMVDGVLRRLAPVAEVTS